MHVRIAIQAATLTILAACGDGVQLDSNGMPIVGGEADKATEEAEPKAEPGFGPVAFTTYRGGGNKLVFINDRLVKITWKNMSGKAVRGTYEKRGNEIAIVWDAKTKNFGSLSGKYRQLGPCSIAYYERVGTDGVVHSDFSTVLEQRRPRCNTVRVAR